MYSESESERAARRQVNRERRAQRETESNEALRLWMSGRTFESIAEALGCSKGTAYNRVQMAIESQKPHADFDAYRSVQMAELKMSRTPLRATVVGWQVGDDLAPVVSAIATLLKLQERESKLLGLDRVPTPFDEISTWSDEYLEEMVGEMAQEFELDS